MGKKMILVLFIFLFSLNFTLAEAIPQRQDAQLDEQYIISQPCASCSYINISVFTKDGVILDNVAMTDNGSAWTYTFTPNTTLRHDVNGIGDINGIDDSFAFWFDTTLSGEQANSTRIVGNIFLLVILFTAIYGLHSINKRVDYDKWYDKIQKKDRTYIKSAIASIPYSLLKNSHIFYYLMGIPIILLITDIIYIYNIASVYSIFSIFSKIYTVGMLLPGVIFLADMIKIIRDLYEDNVKKNWGIN